MMDSSLTSSGDAERGLASQLDGLTTLAENTAKDAKQKISAAVRSQEMNMYSVLFGSEVACTQWRACFVLGEGARTGSAYPNGGSGSLFRATPRLLAQAFVAHLLSNSRSFFNPTHGGNRPWRKTRRLPGLS